MDDKYKFRITVAIAFAVILFTAAIAIPVSIYSHLSQQTQVSRLNACRPLAPAAQVLCIEHVLGY